MAEYIPYITLFIITNYNVNFIYNYRCKSQQQNCELQTVICNSLTPSRQQGSSSLNLSPSTASKSDNINQLKESKDLGFGNNQSNNLIKHISHIALSTIELQSINF